jgi:hypothetical protein
MPYKLSIPERKEFRLEELDAREGIVDSDKTVVTIIQARVDQNAERSVLFSQIKQMIDESGNTVNIYELPLYNLAMKEVYLTMVDCNITIDGDKPLFRFKNGTRGQYLDMNYETFKRAWGLLPDEIANEIHSKVLEVNPHWMFNVGDTSLGEESSEPSSES